MKMNEVKETSTIKKIVEDIIYICILMPLVFITCRVVFISITKPDVIPDVFGYKLFMIFDEYMDDSINNGDLVITHNINPKELKVNDVMAFRNGMNTVTIHKINEINEITEFNEESNENEIVMVFKMNTSENETSDTAMVREDKVEGLVVYKIPKLGSIIYFIQQPLVMLGGAGIILCIGLISIYIAGKLDEKDKKRLEVVEKEK